MKKTLLFVIILISNSCAISSIEKKSKLVYDIFSEDGWRLNAGCFVGILQDSILTNEGDSSYTVTNYSELRWHHPLRFSMAQRFFIPKDKSGDEIEMSINNKCQNLSRAILRVCCFDDDENLIYNNSFDIYSEDWQRKTFSFRKEGTKYFNVEIEAIGDTIPPGFLTQRILLGKINISLGGVTIDNISVERIEQDIPTLNSRYLKPIIRSDKNSYAILGPILNKKIIGLGETLHGSESAAKCEYGIAREQIESNKCKLILFEFPLNETLYWNLYVQGKLPSDAIDDLRERIMLSSMPNVAVEELCQFLLWLREYNKDKDLKVQFLGFDVSDISRSIIGVWSFIDYAKAHVDNNTAQELIPLLKLLWEDLEGDQILKYVEENTPFFETLFGNNEFALFNHSLKQVIERSKLYNDRRKGEEIYQYDTKRDYNMWLNVRKITDIYQKNNEGVLLIGHDLHLNRLMNNQKTFHYKSLGYYLSQHFKEDYQSVTITFGEGVRSTNNPVNDDRVYIETLLPALKNSFEYLAMKSNVECFYYPTDKLDNDKMLIREMPARNVPNPEVAFIYSALSKRTDGIIFIKESAFPAELSTLIQISSDELFTLKKSYEKRQREALDSLVKKYEMTPNTP